MKDRELFSKEGSSVGGKEKEQKKQTLGSMKSLFEASQLMRWKEGKSFKNQDT